MAETKKITATTVALAAALSAGYAGGRISAPVPDSSARPFMMRWLDEGPNKPNRYAITIMEKIGPAQGSVEIVCEADGSAPKLNGKPFENSNTKELCEGAASFGGLANKLVSSSASDLLGAK